MPVTCIVGIANEGKVYIGSDRGASDDSSIISMCRPKVHVKQDWIFGYAGDIGTAQLLEFAELPELEEDDDPYRVLRLDVVEELRSLIESHGTMPNDKEDNSASFLIGAKGRLFELSTSDWSVIEIEETAIGSGGTFALGSLHTTKQFPVALPIYRIEQALNAAITYSPTCQGPIDILML